MFISDPRFWAMPNPFKGPLQLYTLHILGLWHLNCKISLGEKGIHLIDSLVIAKRITEVQTNLRCKLHVSTEVSVCIVAECPFVTES